MKLLVGPLAEQITDEVTDSLQVHEVVALHVVLHQSFIITVATSSGVLQHGFLLYVELVELSIELGDAPRFLILFVLSFGLFVEFN